MLQNALPAVGLLLAMMVVAWLLQRWRRHLPNMKRQTGPSLKVMNALPLGPQQRVVTVQVGEGQDRVCLVLGVTPGGISALHQMALPAEALVNMPADHQADGFKARLNQLLQPQQQENPHAQG
jgi:flagellar protein FliO/FliZ